MPTWRGWNEDDVRQGTPPKHSTGPMGFTPINAPQTGIQPMTAHVPEIQTVGDCASSIDHKAVGHDTRHAVSEYLGVGEHHGIASATQTSHVPGKKKVATRGKKRAATACSSASSKCRKISDVADGMIISKLTPKKSGSKTTLPDDIEAPAIDSRYVADPCRLAKKADTLSFDGVSSSETVHPVSVYRPATSMTSLHGATQQTSVDAAKTAAGRTKTLYRRTQTPIHPQSEVVFAQPWLNQQSDPVGDKSGDQTNGRVLRPRKSENRQTAATAPKITTSHECHDINTANKGSKQAATHEVNTRKGNSSRSRSTARSEEMFPCNEDDDADLLALMNNVEQYASIREKCRKTFPENPLTVPTSSNSLAEPQKDPKQWPKRREVTPILGPDEDFLALIDDDDAADEEEDAPRRSSTPPARERKLNMREVSHDEDYGGALFSDVERELLEKLKSSTSHPGPKPIVRQPFPKSILDRSPIFGASNTTILCTCFRIGEALKEGSQAVRSNKDVVLELYARVTSSSRESRKQHFVFKDLYHDNPPHLEGTFELWQHSRLWELDSKAFLLPREGGVMCRVISRMRRVEMKWRLEVLSIWEAGWEDVEVAAGIYAKEYGFPEE